MHQANLLVPYFPLYMLSSCLCYTVVILTMFLTSFYVYYSDLSSVIFDVTLGKKLILAEGSGDG